MIVWFILKSILLFIKIIEAFTQIKKKKSPIKICTYWQGDQEIHKEEDTANELFSAENQKGPTSNIKVKIQKCLPNKFTENTHEEWTRFNYTPPRSTQNIPIQFEIYNSSYIYTFS